MHAVTRNVRLALALGALPIGCVDEDTNSATGSFVEVDGEEIADEDGADGVVIDCNNLFTSYVGLTSDDVHVGVRFPGDAAPGDELTLPSGDVDVDIEIAGERWNISAGTLVIDENTHAGDMRIAVTLKEVRSDSGRVVSGELDCLETVGDTLWHSCAGSCDGDGGGGGFDDD